MTSNSTVAIEQNATVARNYVNLLESSKPNQYNYIFTEGKDDVSLLGRFVGRETNVIHSGSKEELKKIRCDKKLLTNDFICICDLDYDPLVINDLKWYCYDYCNQEVMLLFGKHSYNNYSKELSLPIETLLSIRDDAINKLCIISCARQFFSKTQLPFEFLKFLEKHYSICASEKNSFSDSFIKKLRESSCKEETISSIHRLSLAKSFTDLPLITNGHDLMEVFFVGLLEHVKSFSYNGIIGKSGIMEYTTKHFAPLIRSLYSESDFKNSTLYNSICSLKDSKGRYFIK